jgi:hypothetical protein
VKQVLRILPGKYFRVDQYILQNYLDKQVIFRLAEWLLTTKNQYVL